MGFLVHLKHTEKLCLINDDIALILYEVKFGASEFIMLTMKKREQYRLYFIITVARIRIKN